MNWLRFVLAVLASGIASSLTDWLFMGDLLYRRYNKYPEIWRPVGEKGETAAIAWSSPLPFLTCAVFAFICARLHLSMPSQVFGLALGIWLIAPLPLIVTHSLFMKLQPAIATAYSLGWLVKLLVAGAAVVWILR